MIHRALLSVVALISVAPGFVAAQPPVDARLAEYRTQIDSVDREIVQLLNKRAAIVARIGDIKKEARLPVAAPARERQVLDQVVEAGKNGPLPPATLRRIYLAILEEMRNWEAAGSPRQ